MRLRFAEVSQRPDDQGMYARCSKLCSRSLTKGVSIMECVLRALASRGCRCTLASERASYLDLHEVAAIKRRTLDVGGTQTVFSTVSKLRCPHRRC